MKDIENQKKYTGTSPEGYAMGEEDRRETARWNLFELSLSGPVDDAAYGGPPLRAVFRHGARKESGHGRRYRRSPA